MTVTAEDLKARIRDVPDFPKAGILFRDITPLLKDPAALEGAIELMARPFADRSLDLVLGIESRGFIFGPAVACRLGAGFVPVRKKGKLPAETVSQEYALEYGVDHVEIHRDAVEPGSTVLVVDDLIATGGTAEATVSLLERCGARIEGLSFLVELGDLGGRTRFPGREVHAVIRY